MRTNYWAYIIFGLSVIVLTYIWSFRNPNPKVTIEDNDFTVQIGEKKVGEVIDSLNGVLVYFNGTIDNIVGENITSDGYNLGLKYQCTEFVNRYYYEFLNRKIPNNQGDAADFFDVLLDDGSFNPDKALSQFSNPSIVQPRENDIIVFRKTSFNRYGHVAIVSKVTDKYVEIVQQNPERMGGSRATFYYSLADGKYLINNERILGWLRVE